MKEIITGLFTEYVRRVYPNGVGDIQRNEYRKAFYAAIFEMSSFLLNSPNPEMLATNITDIHDSVEQALRNDLLFAESTPQGKKVTIQ